MGEEGTYPNERRAVASKRFVFRNLDGAMQRGREKDGRNEPIDYRATSGPLTYVQYVCMYSWSSHI